MSKDFGRLVNLIRNFQVDFRATCIRSYYPKVAPEWTAYGSKFTEEQLKQLEALVEANPWDLKSRTKLIQVYSRLGTSDELAQKKHAEHVLWVAENRPGHPVAGLPGCRILSLSNNGAYQKIKSIWLEKIEANAKNKLVLANAANFLQCDHDPQVWEQAFLQAIALAPKSRH